MWASPKSSSYMQLPWACTNGDQMVRSDIPNRRGCRVYMSSMFRSPKCQREVAINRLGRFARSLRRSIGVQVSPVFSHLEGDIKP